jgi:hypothetical protein
MIMLHFCRRKYSLAPNNFFLSDKLDQIVAISDEEVQCHLYFTSHAVRIGNVA